MSHSTWDGITPALILVTVAPGVIIGSTSTSLDALVIPAMPVGSSIELTNNGYIVGKGGNGGGAGATVNPGENGGNAIRVQFPTTIANNGVIGGGGGGGGSGGYGYDIHGVSSTGVKYVGGGPGGGGAGSAVGAAGTIQPSYGTYVAPPPGGTPGTLTLGGAGGNGAIKDIGGNNFLYGSHGGNGGDLGAAGSSGHTHYPIPGDVGLTMLGANGGAAGKAVIGNEFITWASTGSIYGEVV